MKRENRESSRIETDSLGEIAVPRDALWGAQTQRAIENFPIGGGPMPPRLIAMIARIKRECALENARLNELDGDRAEAIAHAADEVIDGRWADQFPVDIYQTGSGTSTNMNVNEVLAHRAAERFAETGGGELHVHPNDHVNRGQSSNDVIPTAIHLAVLAAVDDALRPALEHLVQTIGEKADRFRDVYKTGRTHLQDAVPISLGDEFGAWATQLARQRDALSQALEDLHELPLGGTAVGTGQNRHPQLAERVIERLAEQLHFALRPATDPMERNASRDGCAGVSAALRNLAGSLWKIADDVRWLGSGPRCGLGELRLPALQPGSSIMPGKVNPVICESVTMVCARVWGNDQTVSLAVSHGGRFQLNMMMPLIGATLLESIERLANACRVFADSCIAEIEIDAERLHRNLHGNLALATALAPALGYDEAARIAKLAHQKGATIREIAEQETDLGAKELDRLLDPVQMAAPRARAPKK